MIKNWLVKTKQIKNKEKGFINHINYLSDKNRSSHHYSKIKILNNKADNILKAVDERIEFRRDNGLRGGGISNYATTFIMSLPRDIKQPSVDDWRKISAYLIKDLAKANNINFDKMRDLTHIVLHDESESLNKPSHIHVVVSNVVDNQVLKSISQYKSTQAVKNSFNRSVKAVLGVDNRKYQPRAENVSDKPLWASREEKATALMDLLKDTRAKFSLWMLKVQNRLFKAAENDAQLVADGLAALDQEEPRIVAKIENSAEIIENDNEVPETAQVTSKRKRRRRKRT